MKVTIEFDCSGEDGIYEKHDAMKALHSVDAFILIHDISEKIRSHFKYVETAEQHEKCLEELQELIVESRLLELLD